MQLVTDTGKSPSLAGANFAEVSAVTSQSVHADYRVIRRNGAVTGFDPGKIFVAMTEAFLAIEGGQGAASAHKRVINGGTDVNQLMPFKYKSRQRRVPDSVYRYAHGSRVQDWNHRRGPAAAQNYPGTNSPFPWMSEMTDLKKERNFFDTRVIEYQSGGALSWD